jgi:MFS family permease
VRSQQKVNMSEIPILIGIHKDQTALIYTLWSVFQGLSLAIIGYVFSQDYVRKNPVLLACLSISILAFAWGNHAAIVRAQDLVVAATLQLQAAAATNPKLSGVLGAFRAPDSTALERSHYLFAAFAAIGVWVPLLAALIAERFGWGGAAAAKKP